MPLTGRRTLTQLPDRGASPLSGRPSGELDALLLDVVARRARRIARIVRARRARRRAARAAARSTCRARCRSRSTCCPTRSSSALTNGAASSPAWPPRSWSSRTPIPADVPARQVPAGVRPARRLVEHRRQRLGRHHLLGPARAADATARPRRSKPTSCSPAPRRSPRATRSTARPRMLVLTVGDGVARLHARPRDRRLHADPPEHADAGRHAASSRSTAPTRASGSRRCSATSTSAWPARPAPRGKDFNMRWIASHGGRGAPHPDARRRLHVPARHARTGQARPPAPAVRGQPDRHADRAGRRRAPAPAASRILDVAADRAAPARAVIFGSKNEVERIERYHQRADQRRGRRRRRCSATAQPVPSTEPTARAHAMSERASHHRHHRLVRRRHHLGDAAPSSNIFRRERRHGADRSKATPSTATTARRCASGMAEAEKAGQPALQPLRPRHQPVRRARAAVPRPTARRHRQAPQVPARRRARPRRTSRSPAPSRPGRTCRPAPTCCSTKACTARSSTPRGRRRAGTPTC